jgi:hypothetical protein
MTSQEGRNGGSRGVGEKAARTGSPPAQQGTSDNRRQKGATGGPNPGACTGWPQMANPPDMFYKDLDQHIRSAILALRTVSDDFEKRQLPRSGADAAEPAGRLREGGINLELAELLEKAALDTLGHLFKDYREQAPGPRLGLRKVIGGAMPTVSRGQGALAAGPGRAQQSGPRTAEIGPARPATSQKTRTRSHSPPGERENPDTTPGHQLSHAQLSGNQREAVMAADTAGSVRRPPPQRDQNAALHAGNSPASGRHAHGAGGGRGRGGRGGENGLSRSHDINTAIGAENRSSKVGEV